MKEIKFLEMAKKISLNSDHHRHQLGAIIVRGSNVIGTGYNVLNRKSTKAPHKFMSIHAEYMAFLNSNRDIEGATIYIFRQLKDGTPSMARPCESCYNFLISKGIKNIVYTCEGSFKKEKMP